MSKKNDIDFLVKKVYNINKDIMLLFDYLNVTKVTKEHRDSIFMRKESYLEKNKNKKK